MNYLEKPCYLCDGQIEDLTYIDMIFNQPHIKTPYKFKIITKTNIPFWWEYQKINYVPYNFFVLKTRLRKHIPMIYNIEFASYQYKYKMIYVVELHDENGKVNLTQKDADQYQILVNQFVKNDHCELILDQLAPNLIIDKQYDPIYDNGWLINLHPKNYYYDESIKGSEIENYYYDYLDVYIQLQNQMRKQIKKQNINWY